MREGVPHAVDPVRRARRAARTRRAAARQGRRRKGWNGPRLYGNDPDDGVGGFGAFFLLLDEPEVYGLPPDPVAPSKHLPRLWRTTAIAATAMFAGLALVIRGGRVSGESITEVGTEMESYYGRPIIKEPTWKAGDPGVPLHRRRRRRLCRAARLRAR